VRCHSRSLPKTIVVICKGYVVICKYQLGGKVKVNSRCGIDLLLGKNVGARGCFGFAPTPVDKSVSC